MSLQLLQSGNSHNNAQASRTNLCCGSVTAASFADIPIASASYLSTSFTKAPKQGVSDRLSNVARESRSHREEGIIHTLSSEHPFRSVLVEALVIILQLVEHPGDILSAPTIEVVRGISPDA